MDKFHTSGVAAAESAYRGELGCMMCLRTGKIDPVPTEEAMAQSKYVAPRGEMARAAGAFGGDEGWR